MRWIHVVVLLLTFTDDRAVSFGPGLPPDGTFSSDNWAGGAGSFTNGIPSNPFSEGDYDFDLFGQDLSSPNVYSTSNVYRYQRYAVPQTYESTYCNLTYIPLGHPYYFTSGYVSGIRCDQSKCPPGMTLVSAEYDPADYLNWKFNRDWLSLTQLTARFDAPGTYYLPADWCEYRAENVALPGGYYGSQWYRLNLDFSVRIVDTTPPVMSSCGWNGTVTLAAWRQWQLPDVYAVMRDNNCIEAFHCTYANEVTGTGGVSLTSVCSATDAAGLDANGCSVVLDVPAFATPAVSRVSVYGTVDKDISLRTSSGTLSSCTVHTLPSKGTLLQTHDSVLISAVPHTLEPPNCNVTFRPTPGPDFSGTDTFEYYVNTSDRSGSLVQELTLFDSALSDCSWSGLIANGRTWAIPEPTYQMNIDQDSTPHTLVCSPYAGGEVLNITHTVLATTCTLTETVSGDVSACAVSLQLPNFTVSTTPSTLVMLEGDTTPTPLSVFDGTITSCTFHTAPDSGYFSSVDVSNLPYTVQNTDNACTSGLLFSSTDDFVGTVYTNVSITTEEFGNTDIFTMSIEVTNVVDPPVVVERITGVKYFGVISPLRVNVTDVDPGITTQNVTLVAIPPSPAVVYLTATGDVPLAGPTTVMRAVGNFTPQFWVYYPIPSGSPAPVFVPLSFTSENSNGVTSTTSGVVNVTFGVSLFVADVTVTSVEDTNSSTFTLTALDSLSSGNDLIIYLSDLRLQQESAFGVARIRDADTLAVQTTNRSWTSTGFTAPHTGFILDPAPHGCGYPYALMSYYVWDDTLQRVSNIGTVWFEVACVNDNVTVVFPLNNVTAVNQSNTSLVVFLSDKDTPGIFESTFAYQIHITHDEALVNNTGCFAFGVDAKSNVTQYTVFHEGGLTECATTQFWTGPLWDVATLIQGMIFVGASQDVWVTMKVWEHKYEKHTFQWGIDMQGVQQTPAPIPDPTPAPTPAPTPFPTQRSIAGLTVAGFTILAVISGCMTILLCALCMSFRSHAKGFVRRTGHAFSRA